LGIRKSIVIIVEVANTVYAQDVMQSIAMENGLNMTTGQDELCENCIMQLVNKLITLNGMMDEFEKLTDLELLLAIGEAHTQDNLTHIREARNRV